MTSTDRRRLRLGMGTDTGPSIRGPSTSNRIAGLKPTYGLPSRSGIRQGGHVSDIAPPARIARRAARKPDGIGDEHLQSHRFSGSHPCLRDSPETTFRRHFFFGLAFSEQKLLSLGYSFEQAKHACGRYTRLGSTVN
jgi:hypothetical protein